MWGRVAEIALALWAAAGPFWLRPGGASGAPGLDLAVAATVAGLALLSYTNRGRRAHLVTLALGLALSALGWWDARGASPPSPLVQSRLLTGLLLATFAIVPSRASRPPPAWQREDAP